MSDFPTYYKVIMWLFVIKIAVDVACIVATLR